MSEMRLFAILTIFLMVLGAASAADAVVKNVATVEYTGFDNATGVAEGSDNVTLIEDPPAPSAKFTKEADVLKARAGDTINYVLTLANAGNVPITSAVIKDTNGPVSMKVPIAPGSFATATTKETVSKNMVELGDMWTNQATVDVTYANGFTEALNASTAVKLFAEAHLSVTKTAGSEKAKIGDTVKWTVTVKSDGDYPATITGPIKDPMLGDIPVPSGKEILKPGESFTVTVDHVMTEDDLKFQE